MSFFIYIQTIKYNTIHTIQYIDTYIQYNTIQYNTILTIQYNTMHTIHMYISSFRHAFSRKRQLCHLGDYLIFVCMDIFYYPLCNMPSWFPWSSKLHVFGRNKSFVYKSGFLPRQDACNNSRCFFFAYSRQLKALGRTHRSIKNRPHP